MSRLPRPLPRLRETLLPGLPPQDLSPLREAGILALTGEIYQHAMILIASEI